MDNEIKGLQDYRAVDRYAHKWCGLDGSSCYTKLQCCQCLFAA